VTKYGIECTTQRYPIERRWLWQHGDPLKEDQPGWIAHVRQKRWADIDDFREAMRFAVKLWPGPRPAKETRAKRINREMDEQWRACLLSRAGETTV
jgi:hypothetical protein